MKRRIFGLLIGLVFCLQVYPNFAQVNEKNLNIPNVKVSINGIANENRMLSLPILEIHGKYYFPMTYTNARHLGIEFQTKEGKRIYESTDISAIYLPKISQQHFKTAKVTVPTVPVFLKTHQKLISLGSESEFIYQNVPYLCLNEKKISENLHINLEKKNQTIYISSHNKVPKEEMHFGKAIQNWGIEKMVFIGLKIIMFLEHTSDKSRVRKF